MGKSEEKKTEEEELEQFKKTVRTMEWWWGPDETRKVLGLLKGRQRKKGQSERTTRT